MIIVILVIKTPARPSPPPSDWIQVVTRVQQVVGLDNSINCWNEVTTLAKHQASVPPVGAAQFKQTYPLLWGKGQEALFGKLKAD